MARARQEQKELIGLVGGNVPRAVVAYHLLVVQVSCPVPDLVIKNAISRLQRSIGRWVTHVMHDAAGNFKLLSVVVTNRLPRRASATRTVQHQENVKFVLDQHH